MEELRKIMVEVCAKNESLAIKIDEKLKRVEDQIENGTYPAERIRFNIIGYFSALCDVGVISSDDFANACDIICMSI